MTPNELTALDQRLDAFLADLVAPMGRSERRHWAKLYIHGLLLDGDRKSIEPMAARLAGGEVQALRQFVGQSPWAVEGVQELLARKLVDTLSEPVVWMIDETAFPKAGAASVGVARAAPARITGSRPECPAARTASANGALDSANASPS